MSSTRHVSRKFTAVIAVLLTLSTSLAAQEPGPLGIGRPATAEEIAAWDIDVSPDGTGLPEGRGSVAEGREVYVEALCMTCHGVDGQGVMEFPSLVGGIGTLASDSPVRTIGSYWPYATTLWDYTFRTMPLIAPQSLSADEVYALVAYMLHLNGIVDEDAVLDQESLPLVEMPNRDGFTHPDPRPDLP